MQDGERWTVKEGHEGALPSIGRNDTGALSRAASEDDGDAMTTPSVVEMAERRKQRGEVVEDDAVENRV